MDAATRSLVQKRACNLCEYCRLPQEAAPFVSFHIDHVIAKQHVDDHEEIDDPNGLALSCDRCNLFKGPNLASVDPISREIVMLFNPRSESWYDHFEIEGPEIMGKTPTGRATVRLLKMNDPRRIALREEWINEGNNF